MDIPAIHTLLNPGTDEQSTGQSDADGIPRNVTTEATTAEALLLLSGLAKIFEKADTNRINADNDLIGEPQTSHAGLLLPAIQGHRATARSAGEDHGSSAVFTYLNGGWDISYLALGQVGSSWRQQAKHV